MKILCVLLVLNSFEVIISNENNQLLEKYLNTLEPSVHGSGIIEKREGNLMYYGEDLDGVGMCGRLAGCKTLYARRGCGLSEAGVICRKCFQYSSTRRRNIMTTNFYSYDKSYLKACRNGSNGCPNIPYIHEMAEYMLFKDKDVERMFQSAQFKDMNIPEVAALNRHYSNVFCTHKCYKRLRHICTYGWVLPHIREWCLTSLDFINDKFSTLRGPASYVLFLAARLGSEADDLEPHEVVMCRNQSKSSEVYSEEKCEWPKGSKVWKTVEREEKAALVAAAAVSVFLTGNWWSETHDFNMFDKRIDEFGFAVQHSIWLAVWAGRLRITIHPRYATPDDEELEKRNKNSFTPGTATLCGELGLSIARNFEGNTGSIYASLCALFPNSRGDDIKLRYRPEIHTRHSLGCVEKVSGMVFIRPGDWFKRGSDYTIIGKGAVPNGLMFTDEENLTTFELSKTGNKFYPSSIEISLKNETETICTDAKATGPNYEGLLGKAGMTGIGGLCNWVPIW